MPVNYKNAELFFLIPEFREKLKTLLVNCANKGFRMDVICTLVTPIDQASFWKNGRTLSEIEMKALALENAGASFLASCLRKGVARETNISTLQLPGQCWHQWCEAAKLVWIDSMRRINWSINWLDKPAQLNGYRVMADEAEKLGLFVDQTLHQVRFRKESLPTDVYSLKEIEDEMKKHYVR